MRPKILITMHYMELGGAESALLGLMQSVNPDRADVDVFIYAHHGELMEYIPQDRIRLLPEVAEYSLLEEPMSLVLRKGYWRLVLARLWGRVETELYKKKNLQQLESNTSTVFQQHRTVSLLPEINPEVEYDLAISFLTPHYIVLDKVRAKKKVGWIHTDYTNVFIHREMELKMWERLDVIASISPEVTKKFVEVFPSLSDRIVEIENILSSEFIRRRSEAPCEVFTNDKCVKLLTIGRYSLAKKMEDIPYICRKLVEEGLDVHWYLIGYGSTEIEQQVRENIAMEGMQDRVIMLGKQSNPYPYIRCCDVYVQPSRYEGKSITVREAQILCKPVVVTHYPTAPSQIQDGVDGVIVPLELEETVQGMIRFLKDQQLQQSLRDYLACHDYGNECEIEKIYALADKQ